MPIVARRAAAPTWIICAMLVAPYAAGAEWTEQQLAAAQALRDRALSGTAALDHVSSLVTEVGPRMAGSSGDAAAVRLALNKLGSLGFSNVRSQDVLVPRWVRGSAEVTLLGSATQAQSLVAVALGGSVGTPEEGIKSQVVEVASLDALGALPAGGVKGKIVFINERMQRTRDGSGYAAAVRKRALGPSIAGNLGALALVIRSVGTSDERIAHTGTLRYSVDAPAVFKVLPKGKLEVVMDCCHSGTVTRNSNPTSIEVGNFYRKARFISPPIDIQCRVDEDKDYKVKKLLGQPKKKDEQLNHVLYAD